jgi:serine/threonine protein phosphatase Stp1
MLRVTMIPFRSAGRSETGLVRAQNEDSMLLDDDGGLWIVFDGMGGHQNGAAASRMAALAFSDKPMPASFDAAIASFAEQIHEVNAQIQQLAAENGGGTMGTTAVGMILRGREFAIGWVGDSRAYIHRRGGLFQLTVDHTHVQDLIDEGILTEADAVDHPMSHVLTRALGVAPELQVDIIKDEVEPGDRFLLCSDGLSGPVTDDEIRALLERDDPQASVDALIERAYANGAPDNVTAVVIEIGAF